MKKLGFNKKNWIALTLAAVLAVGGFGVHKTLAAELIDETKQCKITVQIPTASLTSNKPAEDGVITDAACLCQKDITINFYKLAEVEINGQYGTSLAGIDMDRLNKDFTAEEWKKFADDAYEVVKGSNPNYTMTIKPGDTKKSIDVDRGLYLYVPVDTKDDYYEYKFTKSIISVPSSEYIQGETKVDENGNIVPASKSEEWIYDVTIALKAEATPRYGSLEINKTLKTYNASLGTAAFVFDVEGYDGENNVVFSNVYTMNFDTHGSQKITIDKIPAGTKVVVTEVYSGASYTISSEEIQEGTIVADATESVSFVNDYDERLVVGGLSIENHFKKNEAGDGYEFVDSNISPAQNTIEGGQQ